MSRKHLLREPQRVGRAKDWWFYEEGRGITVVLEFINADGMRMGARQATIPWVRVRAALRRKDRKP